MLCTPAARAFVTHATVLLLPEPTRASAPQFGITVPPSLKITVPVGPTPLIVAVKLTVVPDMAGLVDDTSVVVVEVGVEPLQLPETLPVPSTRSVAVAQHPAAITIC